MTDAADELSYRRIHAAPRELVYACLTTPAHLARFWGPVGTHTPSDRIVVDLRPGGAFETTMVGDAAAAGEHTMRAVYVEVDPPSALSWREVDTGMLTTITLADLGDGTTEVLTRQTGVPPSFLEPGARAGWRTSLDRFADYLGRLAGRVTDQHDPHDDPTSGRTPAP